MLDDVEGLHHLGEVARDRVVAAVARDQSRALPRRRSPAPSSNECGIGNPKVGWRDSERRLRGRFACACHAGRASRSEPQRGAPECTDASVLRRSARACRSPCSSPRYMTATRSDTCRTTDRSCAMKRNVSPNSFWSWARRLTTCAWIETSSADTGSSSTIIFGLRARARATPIRWRWPPENSCGKRFPCSGLRPTVPQKLLDASSPFRATVQAVDPKWLCDDLPDRHPWVQRRVRILKDDLNVPPHGPHLAALELGDVPLVEDDLARGGLGQPDDRATEGRLAAAGLTD